MNKKEKETIYRIKKSNVLSNLKSRKRINIVDEEGYYLNPNPCYWCHESLPDVTYDFGDFDEYDVFFLCEKCTMKLKNMTMKVLEIELKPVYNGLSLRFKVLERDGFQCVYCGRNPLEDKVKLHVDHVIPKSKGGLDVMENLVTACTDCNLGKTDRLIKLSKHIKYYIKGE